MRILASDEQQARKEKILQAVVHLFIKTGKPIGSSTIIESYKVNLSPATIRNVLAELELDGYLTHPHTSAGRVPTDRGYRSYVDSLVNIQKLAVEEERRIQKEYIQRQREIEDLMTSTSRVLSALSNCTGFVLPPKVNVDRLRRIELIPMSRTQLLAVLVSETGFVRNQMIEVVSLPSEETLRDASRFLNQRLSGHLMTEVESQLIQELDQYNRHQVEQEEFIKSIARNLFGTEFKNDVYVEGASNLLKFPEFQDVEAIRHFAQLVDEKETLGEVLSKGLTEDGMQVRIGSEYSPELKHFSVVSSGYTVNGRPVGVLGILGPRRMDYERMMSIVNTVSKLMTQYLEERKHLLEEGDEA
ncbi:MAG: heat-inducible transcriptional repressor HrcA [Elusimicrobiota bacterium]